MGCLERARELIGVFLNAKVAVVSPVENRVKVVSFYTGRGIWTNFAY